jgi:hypothetical protein
VVAIEIAKGYYPAIATATATAEAEGTPGDKRVTREVWGRKRSECSGRRGKEGEGCEEGEDGEASCDGHVEHQHCQDQGQDQDHLHQLPVPAFMSATDRAVTSLPGSSEKLLVPPSLYGEVFLPPMIITLFLHVSLCMGVR